MQDKINMFAPTRLFTFLERMKLISAFQALSAPVNAFKVTDAQAIDAIQDGLALRLPADFNLRGDVLWCAGETPELEHYFRLMAEWAVENNQMGWDNPFAWAVPAARKQGWVVS